MFALIFFLIAVPVFALAGVYADRKISAFVQDRLGPTEVGPKGAFQTIADIIKLLTKEDIVPNAADKPLFKLAPVIIFMSVFAGFAVLPLAPGISGSDMPDGLYYLLGILSLEIIGILMAGWASNNKFALIGSMRSIAQIVSYELPIGLSVLTVVMMTGSLNLQEISVQQSAGGILTWNVFRYPFLFFSFVIYFLASLAECNRGPFDLPEAESELVGGFHTEYSGLRWAFMFLAEYGMMLLTSIVAVVLFWGSWSSPWVDIGPIKLKTWLSAEPGGWLSQVFGACWLLAKAMVLVFLQIMARWTYPRLRADQLMSLCWKYLIPAGLLLILVAGVWRLVIIG
jgi:NADH-quinone oxidoreductase subunit H